MVRQVPAGRVITYGTIARLLGDPRKAREVGWAMAAARSQSPPIPAHRVINAHGALSGGPAFGGYRVQRNLLEAEGVLFMADGRVDLEQYLWLPAVAASGCDAAASEQSRNGDQDDRAHDRDN